MSRIVLGVSGGIAAYKACEVLRRLREAGHEITVVPTENALRFVGETTFSALSGRPVASDVFTDASAIPHVRLGREADLVLVVPATADLLARQAAGRADDLLTNVLLTATCPVLVCPAMHSEMWTNAATRHNVATLRERGVVVLDPASGRLAGPDSGVGRLPEPAEIVAVAQSLLDGDVATHASGRDLSGLRVVVSAGGTHEAIDPVRFIGNASSGRMGVEIARAAALRGAQVTLVAAHVDVPPPSSVDVRTVDSTADLAAAMAEAVLRADVVVMAAAPADFTPRSAASTKIKKSGDEGLSLDLVQTPDILARLTATRPQGQTIVGFAAETIADESSLAEAGIAKLVRKGADLLVVNDVSDSKVFGMPDTSVLIVDAAGVLDRVTASKAVVAHRLLDAVVRHRATAI
ncbi:MAG: bifunctional phosphopantothenoylcysteine decarboxylase/phosphopantothenate--cysteine ligase CoaBC [Actinobacteria bacterium]|nr:bifunctional phosphopantothenoylcysteine decarboxylase/phosphopantothenate--cysteine ligase CoaBC [Actinomycetota bacterium]